MEESLKRLLKNSYSPYSNFRVASIAVMKDGREFCGVNVENASYGASICAERSAIVSAISNGYKKGDFEKIYVYVNEPKASTPCFMCRQVLCELFEENKEVICVNNKGEETIYTIKDLCPFPFDESDLKK